MPVPRGNLQWSDQQMRIVKRTFTTTETLPEPLVEGDKMMTCAEFIDFLEAYFADELPEGVRRDFDRHLACCPDCRNYMKSYGQIIQLSRLAMEPVEVPQMPDGLVKAILASRENARE